MRIGFLTSDLTYRHGWGHYSLALVEALLHAGVQVTVVSARNTPHVDGLPVHRLLPAIAPRDRFLMPRLALLTPQIAPLLSGCDLIHATAEPYAPLADWIAGMRPRFVTVHGSYAYIDRMHRWPSSAIYHHALRRSTLVCVSHYTAGVARLHFGLPDKRTPVVNNGIHPERYARLPPLATPKRGPTVLAVGGIKRRKGTLQLVQAMATVRDHIPDVQCVIIGNQTAEPAYTDRVRAAIHAHDLEDTVHLPGVVDDDVLLGWYGAADLFVLPSVNSGDRFEGFGLVHLEASAAGLPVIGTLGCGVEDAIDDGVTGLLIPQNDLARALPQAILTLLNDPERAAQMGAAGRHKAQTQTWAQVAARMIDLYEEALEA